MKVLLHEPPPLWMINLVVHLELDLQLRYSHPGQVERANVGPVAESATGLLNHLVVSILKLVMLLQDVLLLDLC